MAEPKLVVVGAGLAAANVISTLRDAGDKRPITLVGNEDELPYERPGLSKSVLLGEKEPADMIVHDAQWYADHQVDLALDDPAVAIDAQEHTVLLKSGKELGYDDLVLATGASPRRLDVPGADLPEVHTLRRIEDSLGLRSAFGPDQQVVIIGAGWIGLEAASAARKAGAEVIVLEAADVPLEKAIGKQMGEYFAELHRGKGVDLRTGVKLEAIEGPDKVTGVRFDGQSLQATLVLMGVGASPNTELAVDAGLPVENGVLADEQLHVTPEIYAIGDVANAENSELGRIRVEHWDNAIRQGKMVGRQLLGEEARYDWQPYFFTDQYDLGMEYVGHSEADDDVVIRGDQESGEFIVFWQRDGKVTAAMNVNIWDVNDDLRALIGHVIEPQELANTNRELSDLLGP